MKKNGICSTCLYEPDCSLTQKIDVLQCEEFFTTGKLEDLNIQSNTNLQQVKYSGTYTGICINCELRETCTMYDKDHVIWHCREYV